MFRCPRNRAARPPGVNLTIIKWSPEKAPIKPAKEAAVTVPTLALAFSLVLFSCAAPGPRPPSERTPSAADEGTRSAAAVRRLTQIGYSGKSVCGTFDDGEVACSGALANYASGEGAASAIMPFVEGVLAEAGIPCRRAPRRSSPTIPAPQTR